MRGLVGHAGAFSMRWRAFKQSAQAGLALSSEANEAAEIRESPRVLIKR